MSYVCCVLVRVVSNHFPVRSHLIGSHCLKNDSFSFVAGYSDEGFAFWPMPTRSGFYC